jgi:uncharacterized repeat protein (TIGR01451 family)
MPLFSNSPNQSSLANCLPECSVTTKGLEPARRSLDPNQSSLVGFLLGLDGQRFDAEDSAVTARGHGADLDLSPKDRVSVMHESVSKVSVIAEGSKRARMRASGLFRSPVTMATMIIAVVVMMVGSASAALALSPGTGWEVTSSTFPTDLPPGGTGHIEVNVYNVGAESSNGTVTVTDTLPPGLTATEAGDIQSGNAEVIGEAGLWNCTGTTVVTCTNNPASLPSLPIKRVGGNIEHIGIAVKVEAGASGTVTNRVTVAGGGAPATASTSEAIVVSSTPASSFGLQNTDGWFSNADGTPDTQAGSHPYQVTFSFDLNTVSTPPTGLGLVAAGGTLRKVEVSLPPGFIGNPTVLP